MSSGLQSDWVISYLFPDEKLLWCGEPRRGLLLRGADIYFIPLSIFFGFVAFVLIVNVIKNNFPPEIWIFIVGFGGFAFLQFPIRIIADILGRKNTYYAITDRRVIIRRGGQRPFVKSFLLSTLSEFSLDLHRKGAGTITFGSVSRAGRFFGGGELLSEWRQTRLDHVADGQRVYDLLKAAQMKAQGIGRELSA